jgi:phosphoketolase
MAMSSEQIRLLDAHWRAANCLTVGQVYLRDNPLLREPLTPAHVKPRLLDHWGTSPGERDEGGGARGDLRRARPPGRSPRSGA